MKALVQFCLFAWLVAFFAVPALAATSIVLVDASGSMTGFFATRTIHQLHRDLTSALGSVGLQVSSYAFKHRNVGGRVVSETVDFGPSVLANGSITLLDRAYTAASAEHKDSGIIWMITDNVQDSLSTREEQEDIEKFYRGIENDPRVYRVYFFIRVLDFSGPLYRQRGGTFADNYRGRRAIILYAILLNPELQDTFDRMAKAFAGLNGAPTLVKGLGSAPIKMIDNPELSRQAEEKIPARQRLVLRNGKLSTPADQAFREGETIQASFFIGFESQAANIRISQPDVRAEIVQAFGTTTEDVLSIQPEVRVTPDRLPGDLVPAGDSSGAQPSWVRIDVSFPKGVRFSHSVGAMFRTATRPSAARYEGSINVSIKAAKSAFDFSPRMIAQYNAGPEYFTDATEAAQSRVPHLDTLFRDLNRRDTETVEIVTQPFNISFPVRYPFWPFLLLVLVGVMLICSVYGLTRLANTSSFSLETITSRQYRLVRSNTPASRSSEEPPLDGAFRPKESNSAPSRAVPVQVGWMSHQEIREQGRVLGAIKKRWGLRVVAGPEFLVEGRDSMPLVQDQAFQFSERLSEPSVSAKDVAKKKSGSDGRNVPGSGFGR